VDKGKRKEIIDQEKDIENSNVDKMEID